VPEGFPRTLDRAAGNTVYLALEGFPRTLGKEEALQAYIPSRDQSLRAER
jgi:hypothetical protein